MAAAGKGYRENFAEGTEIFFFDFAITPWAPPPVVPDIRFRAWASEFMAFGGFFWTGSRVYGLSMV